MKSGNGYSRIRQILMIMFTCALAPGLGIGNVFADTIKLTYFTPLPEECSGCVTFAEDGSWAKLIESFSYGAISLEKYSFAIPSGAQTFIFDYDLVLPQGNADYFDFSVYGTPFSSDSDPILFRRFTTKLTEVSGSYTYDVSPYGGQTLAFIFGLTAEMTYDAEYTSSLTISNVQINEALPPNPVPEPATLLLFGSSLAVIGLFRKRG